MGTRKHWTTEEDQFLIEHIELTDEVLGQRLGISFSTVNSRYQELGIARPYGKNARALARNLIFRERLRGTVPDTWYELKCTRLDAKQAGDFFYWDGKPCSRAGHISRRKTTSGGCWDCDYGDHLKKLQEDESFAEARRLQRRKYAVENKAKVRERDKLFKKSPKYKAWLKIYQRHKRETDLNWRLSKNLRDRLYHAITRQSKGSKHISAITLIGCSIAELKRYLETQFTDGMTWGNYGEWHIDHIRPCVSYDLTDPEQQKQCFHFSNLRPLWSHDNHIKGSVWQGRDLRVWPRKRK
jgi:hypothetical protein